MSSTNSKDITARLLANENISIVHENIPTAAFDVKYRVLHLPLWDDMNDDTYSHLIGHEVGHALYTPEQGWHAATCQRGGAFKHFLNVVEDARIEKLVQRRYPGLRGSFIRSYKKMFADGFFGGDIDYINNGNLIDRINTYFKCGGSMGVKFSSEESVWIKEIESAETWEHVEDISSRLYDFARTKAEEKINQQDESNNQLFDEPEEEIENDTDGSYGDMEDFDRMFSDEESQGQFWSDDMLDDYEDGPDGDITGNSQGRSDRIEKELESETDQQLRKNIEMQYGQENNATVKNARFKALDLDIIGYKKLVKYFATFDESTLFGDKHASRNLHVDYSVFSKISKTLYDRFLKDNKRVINHMVKEFEMRKSAAEYVRATVSKTGVIDSVKMNNYKFNDDIFRKVTVVPEGKNHGFLIYLDFSGSMRDCLYDAATQAITLAMFCRQANIPHRVYSFTSSWEFRAEPCDNCRDRFQIGSIKKNVDTCVLEWFNDEMRKSDFSANAAALLGYGYRYSANKYLRTEHKKDSFYPVPNGVSMGGTPFDEVVLGAIKIHDEFKVKYRLDKVNTFFVTDGDSSPFSYIDDNGRTTYFESYCTLDNHFYNLIDDKTGRRYRVVTKNYANYSLTNQVLRLYKDRTGSAVIGYRIMDHKNASISNLTRQYRGNNEIECCEEMKKNNIVEINGSGYDQYFLISKKGLRVSSSEIEIKGDVTKGKLKNAFGRAQSNKKVSRELTNRIMEIVA